nr:hypothetical protein CFP56_48971 [Quercus suber]
MSGANIKEPVKELTRSGMEGKMSSEDILILYSDESDDIASCFHMIKTIANLISSEDKSHRVRHMYQKAIVTKIAIVATTSIARGATLTKGRLKALWA